MMLERTRASISNVALELVLLVMVIARNLPVSSGIAIMPNITLLYVICIYLANGVTPRFLFIAILCGLANDVIAGDIVGVTSLEFTIAAASVHYNSRGLLGQSFKVVWLFILGLLITCGIARIGIHHLVVDDIGQASWISDMSLQALVTVLAYPIMISLLYRIRGM